MLRQLSMNNFILIDHCQLQLGEGLHIFTGETGSGKSMIIEALKWLFGGKSPGGMRAGGQATVIEAIFDCSRDPIVLSRIKDCLAAVSGKVQDGVLCIRREVSPQGKSRAVVNDLVVSATDLGALGAVVLDITSQDSHQALVKAPEQRAFLDAADSKLASLGGCYRERWQAYHAAQKALVCEQERYAAIAREEDYIRYQLKQLDGLSLDPQEEDQLIERKQAVKSLSAWKELAAESESLLGDHHAPVMEALSRFKERLIARSQESGALVDEARLVSEAVLALREAHRGMSLYFRTLDFDDHAIDEIEEKLSALKHLKRKYNLSLEDLAAKREAWRKDLVFFTEAPAVIASLQAQLGRRAAELVEAGRAWSLARRELAEKLVPRVLKVLATLGMPMVQFNIEIQTLADADCATWPQEGPDQVSFLFSANLGQVPRPIAKIASGGELSRVLLAIKSAAARPGDETVYIFDEIDAGIGGETGDLVGRAIAAVAQGVQVLCITHLAQVAQYADRHFVIRKVQKTGRTVTDVHVLADAERTDEIARMLGGEALSDKTRALARDIIKRKAKC